MTGPSLGPLTRCPFAHCSADVMLVIEQATPGDDEATRKRVPQHRMVGEAERFGQCPASLMIIPLDAYSRETLRTMASQIGLMIKPPADPPPPSSEARPGGGTFPVGRVNPPRSPHPLTPRPDPNHEFQRLGYQGAPKRPTEGTNVAQHGKAGQSVTPMPDQPHAGPGPGRASKPYQPSGDNVDFVVPPPQTVPDPPAKTTDRTQQQGSTGDMSNDARAQLIALTRLAIEGFGQQQEQCAALSDIIESNFASIREALKNKQQATHALALAAVGSRSDAPDSAVQMVGASASIGTNIEEIEKTAALLVGWIAVAHAQATAAASHARDYLVRI